MTDVVYTIESDTGLTKIGVSNDVWRRLKILQTGNPHKLHVSSAFEVTAVSAYEMERRLHERLAVYRVVGEWFRVDCWILQAAWRLTYSELVYPSVYARWERRFGRYERMWQRAARRPPPQLYDTDPYWLREETAA